jgi:putative heme-binding domain-containing protein
MRSLCCFAVVLAVLAGLAVAQNKNDPYSAHIAPTDPKSPADEQKTFRLPDGFEVQLVAAEPDIHKPLNIAFDDRGRLWVSDTVEYPYPAPPGKKPRDTVKILDDFGLDGKARKVTTFADGLNIPIGVLPLPGTKPQDALIYSIPAIWRLRDTNGKGQADDRRELYRAYGFKDTHGMTNSFTPGLDGWIYACHGFSNTSTIKGADGAAVTMQSGNTYRLKADGSHLEQWTHGQVNPFGLCFDPLGNLYSCDCHSQPLYQLLRGAYYPSFGKPNDGLGFGPETINRYDDSTAIAGITYYAADQFPQKYRDQVYIGDVVTNRVNLFRLTWHGSSTRAVKEDFLRCDDRWFRPVDVKLGPDGALYIADFYNRIIGHYEVPLDHPGRDRERGRIWRIIYKGGDGKGKPQAPRADWTTATVEELVQDLGHANLVVRTKATQQLVERGGERGVKATKAILEAPPKDDAAQVYRRMHGLWVLDRQGALDEKLLAAAAQHPDRGVRVHAQRVLAERAALPEKLHQLAVAGLEDGDPNVRRAAADALGRHPSAENLNPLLKLRHAVPKDDTHLLHVVRMALRDQLLKPEVWVDLPRKEWKEADERAIADVALGAPNAEAAHYLLLYVKRRAEGQDQLVRFVHHIARHGSKQTTTELLYFIEASEPNNLGRQVALLRALERGAQERGAALDSGARTWAAALTKRLLASKQASELQAGVELVGSLRLEEQQSGVAELAATATTPEPVRAAALAALNALDARKNAAVLGKVLTDPAAPMSLRETAARLLAQANQAEGREQLVAVLATAPARLQTAVAAGLAASKEGAEKLLSAVAAGKASARLLQEKAVEVPLKQTRVPDLEKRLAKLTEGLPKAEQRLQQLIAQRRDGFLKAKPDAVKGEAIFVKNCAICHQVGGKGAKFGPQLDGVGIRGVDRILEDVLDPNRNVDQAFRRTLLNLKNGKVVSGLLLKQEGAVLVLADEQGKEVRVEEKDVDEKLVTQSSPMPANVADLVPEAEFYDLLAYLLAQRAAK